MFIMYSILSNYNHFMKLQLSFNYCATLNWADGSSRKRFSNPQIKFPFRSHSLRTTAFQRVQKKRPGMSEMNDDNLFMFQLKIQTNTQVQSLPAPLRVVMWLGHVQHNHDYDTRAMYHETDKGRLQLSGLHHQLQDEGITSQSSRTILNRKNPESVSVSSYKCLTHVHKSLH